MKKRDFPPKKIYYIVFFHINAIGFYNSLDGLDYFKY